MLRRGTQITQIEEIGADQHENHNGTTNTTRRKQFFPYVVSVVPLWLKSFPGEREAELQGWEFSTCTGTRQGNAMIPFHYFGYWDVPRVILVFHRGHLFLLDSRFKDELDDFDECYDVFLMPDGMPRDRLPENGERFASLATRQLGRVPVKDVIFDDFRGRNESDPAFLDRIGQSAGTW